MRPSLCTATRTARSRPCDRSGQSLKKSHLRVAFFHSSGGWALAAMGCGLLKPRPHCDGLWVWEPRPRGDGFRGARCFCSSAASRRGRRSHKSQSPAKARAPQKPEPRKSQSPAKARAPQKPGLHKSQGFTKARALGRCAPAGAQTLLEHRRDRSPGAASGLIHCDQFWVKVVVLEAGRAQENRVVGGGRLQGFDG